MNPTLRLLNPLAPAHWEQWDQCVRSVRGGSLFHSSAWARVLIETYGHRPCYLLAGQGGGSDAGLACMEVTSPLTGRRGVSLPFTDLCEPLGEAVRVRNLQETLLEHGRSQRWKYLEFRGSCAIPGASPSITFKTHLVDLDADAEKMLQRLEASVRRAIRKAEAARLNVEFSSSLESIKTFYSLHCRTRKKHGVPPQPYAFFQNIARHMLANGHGFVAIARLEGRPLSACVYFHQGREAIYKFGASDAQFQQLRANNLVMWEAMRHLAQMGITSLHLGRTSESNEGLRRFKIGFGSREQDLSYYKYDYRKAAFVPDIDRAETWVNNVFRLLPAPCFRLAGRLLYPHLS